MEKILVVKRTELENFLPKGKTFIEDNIQGILTYILQNHFFAVRDEAEYDDTVKQIIPYVVIRKENELFLLKRLNKQTETRLHDRLSLGIGGHINPTEDICEQSIIEAGLYRELEEEMSIDNIESIECIGIINDNAGGVSDYHMAVAYLLETNGDVAVREINKMEGDWATISTIEDKREQLETWSQIVFDYVKENYLKE